MAGSTRTDDERARHERCPYCHDAFDSTSESGDTRVTCARCDAPHHAQCFVENRVCSVMGCGSREVRVVGREGTVPVGVLEADVASKTLDPRARRRFPLGSFLYSLLIAGLLATKALVGGWPGAAALIIAIGLVVIWLLLRLSPDLPEARVSEDGEPLEPVTNPVLGQAQGRWWGTDPFEAVKARIEAEAPVGPDELRAPAGKAPAECPVCKKALEGEAGDAGTLAFCYHCGASLG